MSVPILASSTIGIVGGGQLGRMMALSAKTMGYKVIILDPALNSPAAQVADEQIVASYDDDSAWEQLVSRSSVITYEFENVDCDLAKKYASAIPQGYKALQVAQHRLKEKNFAKEAGIVCSAYKVVNNYEDLKEATVALGYPCVLKTCRYGYDGKGQMLLHSDADLTKCKEILHQECILESFVSFEKEISVIVTRNKDEIVYFPVSENEHVNGILKYSLVPARIDCDLTTQAQEIAATLIEKLDYNGTLAVELFVSNGQLYFNEMAPRPHNSGHYSIEGCNYSQFTTHIRAICGLPLKQVVLREPTVMVNVLGQDLPKALSYIQKDTKIDSYLHLYGKDEAVVNRKMGHLTLWGTELEQLYKISKTITE